MEEEEEKLLLLEDYMKLTVMQISAREKFTKNKKEKEEDKDIESEEEFGAEMLTPKLTASTTLYDGMSKFELVEKLQGAFNRFKLTVAYLVLYEKLKEFEEIFELSQTNN